MNLDSIRSILPNFQMGNFNMFNKITLLKWETKLDEHDWENITNLILEMISDENYKIIMEFLDVKSWYFDGDGQIKGFYIQDMSENGYENDVRYRVGDYEEDAIKFYCSNVVIQKFEKILS